MTLAEIRKQIPSKGKTCGMNVDAMVSGTPENWLDHALEKLIQHYENDNQIYYAGLATAIQAMTISMTLSGVDWEIIQNALEAMEEYMN